MPLLLALQSSCPDDLREIAETIKEALYRFKQTTPHLSVAVRSHFYFPESLKTNLLTKECWSRDSEHAKFKQTDADVASFDGGFGSAYLARQVGQKFAREIFFLGRTYDADEAFQMGMVNEVIDHKNLEIEALKWASEINAKSPTAIRMLKFAFNLIDDGLVGQQLFAGEATRLAYSTDEASEGRDAFLQKREGDFSAFPYHY